MKPLFVTGTDTGVGKTLVAAAIVRGLAESGLRVVGMKPVASGCVETPEGLRNEDALALQAASNLRSRYSDVNPYAFVPAIAPHIAAGEAGVEISLDRLEHAYERLALSADVVVIEGAGGWLTPLDSQRTLADFAAQLDADVLLVVGLRLGCINHAVLTARAVQAAGLRLCGWVGNAIDPRFERRDANLKTLSATLRVPCLGVVSHAGHPTPAATVPQLDLGALRNHLSL
jgi:dethiobiotin synthetase